MNIKIALGAKLDLFRNSLVVEKNFIVTYTLDYDLKEKHSMLEKIFIIIFMIVILFCLGSGLVYLVKDGGKSKRVVKALTFRIGLSLFLFILMILGFAFGWIHPHSLA